MKKTIVLICVICMLFSLVGCQEEEYGILTEPPYSGNDYQQFIEDWKAAQQDPNAVLYAKEGEIIVPVLVSEEYILQRIWFQYNTYHFVFRHKNYVEENRYIENITELENDDSKERQDRTRSSFEVLCNTITFDLLMEHYGVTPENGVAHNEEYTHWYIDYNGKGVQVWFYNMALKYASELDQYVRFETVTTAD